MLLVSPVQKLKCNKQEFAIAATKYTPASTHCPFLPTDCGCANNKPTTGPSEWAQGLLVAAKKWHVAVLWWIMCWIVSLEPLPVNLMMTTSYCITETSLKRQVTFLEMFHLIWVLWFIKIQQVWAKTTRAAVSIHGEIQKTLVFLCQVRLKQPATLVWMPARPVCTSPLDQTNTSLETFPLSLFWQITCPQPLSWRWRSIKPS